LAGPAESQPVRPARLALVERRDELLAAADVLNDLRIGLNIAHLQQARTVIGPAAERSVARLLDDVSAYFRKLGIGRDTPLPRSMLGEIDTAIGDVAAAYPSAERQTCLWSLAGLRRNLFPQAGPYIPFTASGAAS
jgi:hypothetical protein